MEKERVRFPHWLPILKDIMKVLNFPQYNTSDLLFTETSVSRKYNMDTRVKWETIEPNSARKALKAALVLHFLDGVGSSSLILDYNDAIVQIEDSKTNSEVTIEVRSNNTLRAQKIIESLKKVIQVAPEPQSDEISVRFWYLSPNGPKSVHRNIAAPEWDTISDNYASNTHAGLNHLMTEFKPTSGGQLILWHGEPGTGKTYALRALCHAWKEWCSVEYIMDPETLLGGAPGYLASMIMNDDDEFDMEEEETAQPWKLLIMEDTGELLTEHARERAGQGLSRLLNVVDGFIGQGLRVLVLITTNEEFHTLHPAVSREGRCAAAVKFDPLNKEEAELFLKAHKLKSVIKGDTTIAELYALLKQGVMPRDIVSTKTNGLGFRVPTNV